jgi:hypothetical protein
VRVRDVPVSAKRYGSSERRPGQKTRAVTPICLASSHLHVEERGSKDEDSDKVCRKVRESTQNRREKS